MQEPINQEKTTIKEFIHSKKGKTAILTTIFSALIVIFLTIFLVFYQRGLFSDLFFKKTESDSDNEKIEAETITREYETLGEVLPDIADDEIRGIFIASVLNINFPSRPGLSEQEQKKELDSIVAISREAGLDTLYFQVRPTADALYPSKIFPTSRYLVENEGDEISFDPFMYLIETAESYNMKVMAWVNPYRITNFKSDSKKEALAALSENNPARLHPDWTVFYGGKLYYNPALQEVRDLIASGVREICENYRVAGILYDDYFYPYKVKGETFDDAKAYASYKGELSLDDWRRENVNKMVKQSFETVKSVSENITFGISPFGIWQNSSSDPKGSDTKGTEAYSELYCDALAWIDGGYIDFLAPQIYWERGSANQNFDTLTRWWSAQVDGTKVKLYIAHAAYKVQDFSLGAEEIVSQISYARAYMGVAGSIFYGFDDIQKNTKGLLDQLHRFYEEPYDEDLPLSGVEGVRFVRPQNGLKTDLSAQFVSVSSDPKYPVYSDYGKVGRTKSGLFSYLMTLGEGKNTLTFTQNGINYSLQVTKTKSNSLSSTLSTFCIESFNPTKKDEVYLSCGQPLPLTLTAPVGCKVFAVLDGKEYEMKPSQNLTLSNPLLKQVYKGSILIDSALQSDSLVSKGAITFFCQKGENELKETGPNVFLIPESLSVIATVKNDYSHLKVSPDSSFYDDFTPSSVGMTDRVLVKADGYCKLSFGGYVATENVDLFIGQNLPQSSLSQIRSEADEKETRFELFLGAAPALNFKIENDVATVTLFSTSCAEKSTIDIPKSDHLFSSASYQSGKDGTVLISFALKNQKNYYGFDYSYDNGCVILRFHQPSLLEKSDTPFSGKTVLLDAGHGGKDSGALGFFENYHEKDLNLSIILELANRMEELGANVILSRNEDETVSLNDRMDLLTNSYPDLAISIHHNSVSETTDANNAKGTLGLYWSKAGLSLTDFIREAVSDAIGSFDAGTRQQKLAVCRNHRFPQMLLEAGYICSPAEFQTALRTDYANKVADAVVQGVVNWYQMQESFVEGNIK